MNDEIRGATAIMAAAIMYGFTGVFIRFLTGIGLNVYSINFVEFLFGVVLIFFITDTWGKKITFPAGNEWLYLISIGFCFFGTTITLYYAFNYTTMANAEFLHYTFPVLTIFGAVLLLDEKLDTWKLLALILSIVGLVLIFNQALNISRKMIAGSICAFLSAFPVAAMTLIGRKLKDRSAYFTTFWGTLFACIVYLPFFILNNSITSLQQIGYIFQVSVFFTAIAAPLYFFGLRHTPASTAGILLLIEILSGITLGLIFYKEALQPLNLLGGLVIIVSCVLVLGSEWVRSTAETKESGLHAEDLHFDSKSHTSVMGMESRSTLSKLSEDSRLSSVKASKGNRG